MLRLACLWGIYRYAHPHRSVGIAHVWPTAESIWIATDMIPRLPPLLHDEWRATAGVLHLDVGTVDVWRVDLDAAETAALRLRAVLSQAELQRADALRDALNQARFISAHAALRHILARYLQVSPACLVFVTGKHGKPRLAQPHSSSPLHFSMAHSSNLALFAVAGIELGVDVERMRPMPEMEEAAPRLLSQKEISLLEILVPEDRPVAFHILWACKEAYAKATGSGLWLDLTHTTILPRLPDDPSTWFALSTDSGSGPMPVHLLAPHEGFVAALVLRGESRPLRLHQFSPAAFDAA